MANNMPQLLSDKFLSQYPTHPQHMNHVALFTFYRSYSRFLPDEGRRETWKETVTRTVLYNMRLEYLHRIKVGLPIDDECVERMTAEAEYMFDNIFNLRQFTSGRTMWVGGTAVADEYPMSNFNCSFTNVEQWEDLPEIFYLLMLGSGVGFKCTLDMAKKLPKIRCNVKLLLAPYVPIEAEKRLEKTAVNLLDNGYAKIYVGDSKEGWRDALDLYLKYLTKPEYEHIHTIKISFNSVRPRGERLKRFGGTASGPAPLIKMFQGFDDVLKNRIDPALAMIEQDGKGYGHVRPIHILDMGTMIANNVVSGNVRRSAMLFLFDVDDLEVLFAKYGINGFFTDEQIAQHNKIRGELERLNIPIPRWFDEVGVKLTRYEDRARKGIEHRHLSNNSIGFHQKPSEDFVSLVFDLIKLDAEPGFINMTAAEKRRPNMHGINPCLRGDTKMMVFDPEQGGVFHIPIADLDGKTVPIVNGDNNITMANFWKSGVKEIWEVRMQGQDSIFCTADHRFLASDGDPETNDFREMEAKDLAGKWVMGLMFPYLVTEVINTGKMEEVYDFTENATHWGVGNGVYVHNCAEILLDSKEQCNLTTINVTAFSENGVITDYDGLLEAQALSARIGLRMALVDLELPEWNKNQRRDMLTGCSMTGWSDATWGMNAKEKRILLNDLRIVAQRKSEDYASELRVPRPLLITTLKPEGSISLVANGVSPGLHDAHSEYFIRRIRVSADDALAELARASGWVVNDEKTNTQDGDEVVTLVIDFPVKSGAPRTKDDVGALEQLGRYFMFVHNYVNHNASNTISVRPDEWDDLTHAILENWDDYVGVSFIPHDGGTYHLAPYEAITKEKYDEMVASYVPFDHLKLQLFETDGQSDLDYSDPDCATGACPIR